MTQAVTRAASLLICMSLFTVRTFTAASGLNPHPRSCLIAAMQNQLGFLADVIDDTAEEPARIPCAHEVRRGGEAPLTSGQQKSKFGKGSEAVKRSRATRTS